VPELHRKIIRLKKTDKALRQSSSHNLKKLATGKPIYTHSNKADVGPGRTMPIIGLVALGTIVAAWGLGPIISGWGGWLFSITLSVVALVLSQLALRLIFRPVDRYTWEWLAYLDMLLSVISIVLLLGLGIIGLMFGDP
jgi:hypothetical protein